MDKQTLEYMQWKESFIGSRRMERQSSPPIPDGKLRELRDYFCKRCSGITPDEYRERLVRYNKELQALENGDEDEFGTD